MTKVDEVRVCEPGRDAAASDDASLMVLDALRACRAGGARRLVFPRGVYHFRPDRASEHYLFVSNNDEGLKRVALPIVDVQDLEIDGQGSTFVFHGYVTPFAVLGSRRIAIRNLVVDWARPFHSEGRVTAVRDDGVDVRFDDQYPYTVRHGRLGFTGEGTDAYRVGNVLEFDPVRRETAFLARDNYAAGTGLHAEDLGGGHVRLTLPFTSRPTVGNVLVFQDTRRHCPAVVISDSADVALSDVTLHHCGGMGVIAQWTRDVTLERVRVTPPAGGGRVVSLTADATHFVNCAGTVRLSDCLFENQMDDATNVHGIYGQVTAVVAGDAVEVRSMHHQQWGVDVARAGDKVELVRSDTLLSHHEAIVRSVHRLNKEYVRLTFDAPLPPDVRPGDCVGNLSWQADVVIERCVARGNRARGFLLSTAGNVRVEGNTFHTPGAAILIAGDANFWFESGAVRDVTIRGNTFDNCNFGVWGRACIDVQPEIRPEHRGGPAYHRDVVVEENLFRAFDGRLARVECVDGLVFRNNRVVRSTDYPPQHTAATPVQHDHCRRVSIDSPAVLPAPTVGFKATA